eukprot:scaffold465_cov120-Isochrysis_galbana.AAC.1
MRQRRVAERRAAPSELKSRAMWIPPSSSKMRGDDANSLALRRAASISFARAAASAFRRASSASRRRRSSSDSRRDDRSTVLSSHGMIRIRASVLAAPRPLPLSSDPVASRLAAAPCSAAISATHDATASWIAPSRVRRTRRR